MSQPVQGLVITQEELNQLDALIGELKTKEGLRFVSLLNGIITKRQQEAQAQYQLEQEQKSAELKKQEAKVVSLPVTEPKVEEKQPE